ncbi:MAG: alpha/beta hydrolase [Bacillota bacterium]
MRLMTPHGVPVAYLRWDRPGAPEAAGPTVVLIHGLTGRAALWDGVARFLADRGFQVLAPDLRNHGDAPRTPAASPRDCARDVVALIAEVAPGPVDLVGHSFGAAVAWEVAAAWPDRVRRLVLEDQPPVPPAAGWAEWEAWAAAWPPRFASREEGLAYLRREGRSLPWWEPSLVPLPDGGWGWAFDIPGTLAMARHLYEADPEAAWAQLARVQAPTLVLRGSESTHLLPEVAREMVRTLPRGRLVTVPGADHWIHRRPEPYARLVAAFLTADDPLAGDLPLPDPGPAGSGAG